MIGLAAFVYILGLSMFFLISIAFLRPKLRVWEIFDDDNKSHAKKCIVVYLVFIVAGAITFYLASDYTNASKPEKELLAFFYYPIFYIVSIFAGWTMLRISSDAIEEDYIIVNRTMAFMFLNIPFGVSLFIGVPLLGRLLLG